MQAYCGRMHRENKGIALLHTATTGRQWQRAGGLCQPEHTHFCHMTPLAVQSGANAFTGQVVVEWP